MSEALAVASLIPHRGPARLVCAVLVERPDGLDCIGRVPGDSPFVRGGRAPSFIGLEMAAQAAAMLEALSRIRQGGDPAPRVGYLVGIRDARLEVPEIPADVDLVASVLLAGGVPPLSRYEVWVRHHDVVCVRGTISTYLAPEPTP